MKFRIFLVSLCLLLLAVPNFAQETVEWGDLGLSVEVPEDWEFDDSGENALLILFMGNDLEVDFYEPWGGNGDAEDFVEVILDTDGFEFGDVEEIELLGDVAYLVPFANDDVAGFSVSFDYDGQVLFLDAYVYDDEISEDDFETLLDVVLSLSESEGGNNNNSSGGGDTIETVADEDASGEEIVEELVELELVTDEGEILFEEDEIEEGIFDFAEGYEGGAVVMGGWLSIELAEDDDDYRFCTFVAQSTTDDAESDEGTMLITGFDSTGALIVYEYDIADEDNTVFEAFDAGVDADDENHFLMVVQDDTLSVYVNGELVVEEFELEVSAGDDELFTGFVVGEGCSMTNVWAYSFE